MNIKKNNLPDFWQFSLTLYKHDLVQSALITWQNDVNANVNLALLCAMLNQQKIALTQSQLMSLHTKVSDFSNDYTKPLRALRQRYKEDMDAIEGYPAIRQKLLDAELMFEQQEQSLLLSELSQSQKNKLHSLVESSFNMDNLALYQALLIEQCELAFVPKAKLTDLNQYLV